MSDTPAKERKFVLENLVADIVTQAHSQFELDLPITTHKLEGEITDVELWKRVIAWLKFTEWKLFINVNTNHVVGTSRKKPPANLGPDLIVDLLSAVLDQETSKLLEALPVTEMPKEALQVLITAMLADLTEGIARQYSLDEIIPGISEDIGSRFEGISGGNAEKHDPDSATTYINDVELWQRICDWVRQMESKWSFKAHLELIKVSAKRPPDHLTAMVVADVFERVLLDSFTDAFRLANDEEAKLAFINPETNQQAISFLIHAVTMLMDKIQDNAENEYNDPNEWVELEVLLFQMNYRLNMLLQSRQLYRPMSEDEAISGGMSAQTMWELILDWLKFHEQRFGLIDLTSLDIDRDQFPPNLTVSLIAKLVIQAAGDICRMQPKLAGMDDATLLTDNQAALELVAILVYQDLMSKLAGISLGVGAMIGPNTIVSLDQITDIDLAGLASSQGEA